VFNAKREMDAKIKRISNSKFDDRYEMELALSKVTTGGKAKIQEAISHYTWVDE
jgi:hypothetical protein